MASILSVVLAFKAEFAVNLSKGANRAFKRIVGKLDLEGLEGDRLTLSYMPKDGERTAIDFVTDDPWGDIADQKLDYFLRVLTRAEPFPSDNPDRDELDIDRLCREICRIHMNPANATPFYLASRFHPENRVLRSWVKFNMQYRPERVKQLILLRRTLWRGNGPII